jgi:protoporphyrinogen oxidase
MASVVVVGGGLAGLVCAWRLARAGHDVEVLEREAKAGGSARSEARLGFRLERGPRIALRGDANLSAVLAGLGLEAALEQVPERALGILRDGRIFACDTRSPARLLASAPLHARARLRCARLGLELLRRRRLLDASRPERAAPLDGHDVERLRRRAGEEAWAWLLAPALAAATGTKPAALSEAAALLALRRAASGLAPRRIAGGAGRLVGELASRVTVRSGCDVVHVETETDGARVRYRRGGRERTVLAEAAVVALSGPAVARLCPKLTPAERGFFEALDYAPQSLVHLLLDRPAGAPALVLVPEAAGRGLAAVFVETEAAPPGAGLLAAVLDGEAARRLGGAPDAAVVAHALEGLASTPLGRIEVAHAVVSRVSSGVPRFGPGSLRRLAAFTARVDRSPRLAFAGDYRVAPGLEGAVTSGMRAATEIAREL